MAARVQTVLPGLLAALALVAAGCGDDGEERVAGGTLVVYASAPTSGAGAAAGRDEADGVRLVLAHARGRAGGERVRLRVLDANEAPEGRPTPRQVALNARTARRDRRTVAYIGETEPAASAVSAVILNVAGILQVSPTDTFAGLTRPAGAAGEPGRYAPRGRRTFARIVPEDTLQARAAASWIAQRGRRRLLLVDDGGLYGRSLTDRVGAAATARGVAVVGDRPLDPRPGRLRSSLASLRALRPDAIFLGAGAGPQARSAWAALATVFPRAERFGPGALATPDFAAGALPGRLVAPAPVRIDPGFARAFRRRYGRPASAPAALAAAAMAGVLQAIAAVPGRAPSRTEVARAFLGLRVRASPIGPFAIGARGDSDLRGAAGYEIRRGSLRLVRIFRKP